VSDVVLNARELEELYVILKSREKNLVDPLGETLRRIERALFQHLTIEEMEKLVHRISEDR
jgi:hypothetical protein